mmetsp:Transcript_2714/g.4613  ORF Transcript_2714/g.4613 Transcript_2714/m.4613 type:complete len:100 (+) Transcript_2714:604-903(+)
MQKDQLQKEIDGMVQSHTIQNNSVVNQDGDSKDEKITSISKPALVASSIRPLRETQNTQMSKSFKRNKIFVQAGSATGALDSSHGQERTPLQKKNERSL